MHRPHKTGWSRVGERKNSKVISPSFHPCGNFSDTSSLKLLKTKGSVGHSFTVCIHTENQNQVSFHPFVLHEISVLTELTLGHLRYHLTDVPPQPNSRPDSVFGTDRRANEALSQKVKYCHTFDYFKAMMPKVRCRSQLYQIRYHNQSL